MPPVNLTPPAALLTARPDIESAEAGLLSANADIGVARAVFFPSLTLGLDTAISAGFGGPAAAATSIASSLLAPIFTGGRLTGNLENVTARQKELAVQYRQIVLLAFQEVEDALAALKSNNDRAVLARTTVAESQICLRYRQARFDAGAIDYLNLLDAQAHPFLAQDSQISINQGPARRLRSAAQRWLMKLNISMTRLPALCGFRKKFAWSVSGLVSPVAIGNINGRETSVSAI